MKTKILVVAMVMAGFSSSMVFAAAPATTVSNVGAHSAMSSTVHFTGKIEAATCVVSSGPTNKDVPLPTVQTQMFGGDNSTTGDTPFTLSFTGCNAADNHGHKLAVHFDGNEVASHKGVLVTQRGGTPADDVGILVEHAGVPVVFSSGANAGDLDLQPDASGNASIDLTAKYEQTKATLPLAGDLTADMTYTVAYK